MTLETNDLHRHLSGQYNKDLEALLHGVLEMGQLVIIQLRTAVDALERGDEALGRLVVARDQEVNALELRLDEECRDLVVLRQPAAGDMRLVFVVIKLVIDLERMGDQAKRVARGAIEASGVLQREFGPAFGRLGPKVLELVNRALEAFASLDVTAALDVKTDDRAIDQACKAVIGEIVSYVQAYPQAIGGALDLILAARALERIGDHAKNIAEYVVYAAQGKEVRHMGEAGRTQ